MFFLVAALPVDGKARERLSLSTTSFISQKHFARFFVKLTYHVVAKKLRDACDRGVATRPVHKVECSCWVVYVSRCMVMDTYKQVTLSQKAKGQIRASGISCGSSVCAAFGALAASVTPAQPSSRHP
jgi:hypothetical protein